MPDQKAVLAQTAEGHSEQVLHYLADTLLPLCDTARIMRGEDPPAAPTGCIATPVIVEVTCPECREWLCA